MRCNFFRRNDGGIDLLNVDWGCGTFYVYVSRHTLLTIRLIFYTRRTVRQYGVGFMKEWSMYHQKGARLHFATLGPAWLEWMTFEKGD